MTFSLPVVAVVAAAGFGAMVGSFLNVCIYRLPRGLSVNSPRRSFCPECHRQIPWYQNLPVVAWLALRGRCAGCQAPISPRYLAVELLTSMAFAAVTLRVGVEHPGVLMAHCVLASLMLVATFVDLEHLIIPDEVTWGGVAMGLAFSALAPALHGMEGVLHGLAGAALGALAGYGVLWAVAEGGRLVFGRRRYQFEPEAVVLWKRTGETAQLTVDGEALEWAELFPRGTETVAMEVLSGEVEGKRVGPTTAVWRFERLMLEGREVDLNQLETVECTISALTLPREVMGYGDVKFLAALGAFLGWKAVFFTVLAASVCGAVFGVVTHLIGKREWSAKIPFGPFLAVGAFVWQMRGPELLSLYLAAFAR